jgi:hypothetical protein
MSSHTATLEVNQTSISEYRRSSWPAVLAGFIAVIWFLTLSGWMDMKPGKVMMNRPNVLFSSDTNRWVDRFAGNTKLPPIHPYGFVHPLEEPIWRATCRFLYYPLKAFMSSDDAIVLSARLNVALVAGIGVGFLFLIGLRTGLNNLKLILLFVICLLCTSNVTVCLPEHFGFEYGLLAATFAATMLVRSKPTRAILLTAFAVVDGGTIITNVLFPVGCFIRFCIESTRLRLAALATAALMSTAAGVVLVRQSSTIHWFTVRYSNLSLLNHPVQALINSICFLVYPVIGPYPQVARYPGWDMVTYDPMKLSYYSWAQAFAVVAWFVLLSACVVKGLREEGMRPYVWTLLAWLGFNIVFHNMWGTELYLYAPDWCWALIALLILGARNLSPRFLFAMFVPIVVGQAFTLFHMKAALETITI